MKALILLSLCLTAAHGLPSFNLSDTSVDLVAATWYAGWHAELFPLANVSWEKYTHITYSFAETTNNVSALDLSGSDPEMLPKFVKKAHQEGVKALVSIGGVRTSQSILGRRLIQSQWTGGRFYSSNVASAENRTAFVETVTDLATKYHLDGLDFECVPILFLSPSLLKTTAGSTPQFKALAATQSRPTTPQTSSPSSQNFAPTPSARS